MHEFYSKYFHNNNVTTDSRNVNRGDIFVALKGDNFDGNKYAKIALDSGAVVAVIDNKDYHKKDMNFHLVENGLSFLQELANFHRRHIGIHIIGITGTNGKTTTKELIRTVLAEKYTCDATKGNLNNHIGVPLTLLSFDKSLDMGIVEMGANHVGEIAELCKIAEPDSGLITNIGKAHLEGFGSFEGVIKAKSELYDFLISRNKKIYVNGNDKLLTSILKDYKNIVEYNNTSGNYSAVLKSNYPSLVIEISSGSLSLDLISHLHGEYNITNIIAAACIALDQQISLEQIAAAITSYMPDNNRSERMIFGNNQIIFDCYNANPTSMQVAIESFGRLPEENKIVVLGEMKELGQYKIEEHQKIADLIKLSNIDEVYLIGEGFDTVDLRGAIRLKDVSQLENYLRFKARQNTSVLVKGSRANKLEQLKDFLPKSD